jgi:hypothetical protein
VYPLYFVYISAHALSSISMSLNKYPVTVTLTVTVTLRPRGGLSVCQVATYKHFKARFILGLHHWIESSSVEMSLIGPAIRKRREPRALA